MFTAEFDRIMDPREDFFRRLDLSRDRQSHGLGVGRGSWLSGGFHEVYVYQVFGITNSDLIRGKTLFEQAIAPKTICNEIFNKL